MAFFEFPHTRTYDSDLGWLIHAFNEISRKLDEYLENAVITFADPIMWDITEQYTALTCVIDSDGTAYLSKQPVPAGVDISNTDYWQPIFNYNDDINNLRSNIAPLSSSGGIIPGPLPEGALIWYQGNLYITTTALPAGSQIIPGSNANQITVEEFVNQIVSGMDQDIQDLQNDMITAQGDITTIQGDITNIQGDITNIQNIISGLRYVYDNVADMIADAASFLAGDYAQTAGYYAPGDGGGCLYRMQTTANAFTTAVGSLYAMPIIDEVYPEMFGAQATSGVDDHDPFVKAINYIYYVNPAYGRIGQFSRGFGGGCLHLNPKKYYILTPIDLLGMINLSIEGTAPYASEIECTTSAFLCDYSNATTMVDMIPWNFTVSNVTFFKTTNDGHGIIEIDRPYGMRLKSCRFSNGDGAVTTYGRAILMSTTVDVIIDECTFEGFAQAIRITEYGGTYPVGTPAVYQNTTVAILNSVFIHNNLAIQAAFSTSGFIQNLYVDNTIIESNGGGISVNGNVAANASQLIVTNSYFELNSSYAVNVKNSALIFDESNIINRLSGDSGNKIMWMGSRANTNGYPLKNYIYSWLQDTIQFADAATERIWFDAFPTIYKSPIREINTFERTYTVHDQTVIGWWNTIPNHASGVLTVNGPTAYGNYLVTLSSNSMTSTVVGSASGVTVRSDGALVTGAACTQTYKW